MTQSDSKKFYNEVMPKKFGSDYEYWRWRADPIREVGYQQTLHVVREFLDKLKERPETILEIGPGAGTWTKEILARFPSARLTLLDVSSEMLARAERAIGSGKAKLVESDILTYESDEPYDLLFASRMVEYVEHKRHLVERFSALLAPGGVGFIITKMPHYDRDVFWGRRLSRFHRGQIAPNALRGMLLEEGLEVTEAYPVTASVPLLRSALANRFAGWVIQKRPLNVFSGSFVESYCVAFRKPTRMTGEYDN